MDNMNLQEQISRIKEIMSIDPSEKVYDYQEGRNTVPERLPFDINKLVNSGVVFVTPAIDGDTDSKTYKEWLEGTGSHLITLFNVIKSSKDGWIRKAITKRASTKGWKSNFVNNIYDGKYNQILWSLEKLGIDPMDMLIDGETGEINEMMGLREEVDLATRRRLTNIKRTLEGVLRSSYPCDYDNLKSYFFGIIDELNLVYRFMYSGSDVDSEQPETIVKKYLKDVIKEYYLENIKDC
jgi:hypothetical protein